MHGRLLFLCLAVVPCAHGAAECHGRRFGDTTQRFNDTKPPNPFLLGMPEGVPPPIHLVSAVAGGFGCTTAWAIDLDTGKAWRRARCQSAESLREFVGSVHWAGARFNTYTSFDGSSAPEAVKEGTVAPALVERLACLANEAWATGKWGGVARFDDRGQLLPEPPQPPPIDAIATIVLKVGETTRTLGQDYVPQPSNSDGKLAAAITEAVNEATRRE
jgi:hypothetical protein